MDGQKDVIEIIPSKPSPPKNLPSTNATPGASKLFIITPDRIAKLGLTQQINKSLQSQQINKSFPTPPPGLQISKVIPSSQARLPAEDSAPKKNIKISKITLVTPKKESSPITLVTPSRSEGASTKESVTLSMKNKLAAVLNRQHTLPQVDDASKRRKRENIETLVSKISKNKDDDVIMIDAPKKESHKEPESKLEIAVKPERIDDVIIVDQTLEKAKIAQELKGYSKPIVLNLINNLPVSNDLDISVSTKTESDNVSVVEIQSSPPPEETKQKITVLSNEQISLPNTYIASLKMNSQEQKMFLSKTSSNSPGPVKEEVADVTEEVVEIKQEAEIKEEKVEVKEIKNEIEENEENDTKDVQIKQATKPQLQPDHSVKEESESSSKSEKSSTLVSKGFKHAKQDDRSNATQLQNDKIKNPDDKSSKPNNSEGVTDSPGQLKQEQQTIKQYNLAASKPANDQKEVKNRLAKEQIIDLSESSDHEENVNKPNIIKSNEANKEKAKQPVIKKSVIISKVVKPNGEELKLNTAIIKTYSRKINSLLNASLAQEAKETAANAEANAVKTDTETPQQTPEKPPPKKRGRKRKSEIIPVEEPPEPEPEIEMSRRGRKRKVVNYFALAEGDEFGELQPSVPVNRRQSQRLDSEAKNDESTSSESEQPKNTSVDSVTPQETPPKRKRGRPPRIKPVENTPTENKADETPAKDVENMDTGEASKTKVVTPKREGETPTVKSELNDSSMTETYQEGSTDHNRSEFLNSSKEESALPPKKRRGRPPKVQVVAETAVEASKTAAEETPKKGSDTDATTPSVPEKRRVGRPPKKCPLTQKANSNSKTPITENGNVTCAVCNQNMPKPQWATHKYKFHNNLAWRVGEPPLDLDDQKVVTSILAELYKKRKPMHCEKCGEQKKSVVGFLSHKSLCQKSEEEVMAVRVKCEYCDHTVLPVSMPAHLKCCKGYKGDDQTTPEQNAEELDLSCKRKAASRANDLISSFKEEEEEGTKTPKGMSRFYIQNFNFKSNYYMKRKFRKDIETEGKAKCLFEDCSFKSSDVDKICSHLLKCEQKPIEGFTCKYCIITFVTEDEVHQHLKDVHLKSTQETEAEHSDDEEECDGTGVNKTSSVSRSSEYSETDKE